MNVSQYMPFFLTGFFPCFLVLVGMWQNNKRIDHLDAELKDIKILIQHFIDISMDHGEREHHGK